MKPIKFQELSPKGGNLIWLLLLVASAVFVLLNTFDVLYFENPKVGKWINLVCFLIITTHNLRPFYYRNYVQWNKRGISIRVNSFWGFNFSFADVKRIEYAGDRYTVYKYSNGWKPKVINLKGIEQESKERLLEILRSHVLSPVREENG